MTCHDLLRGQLKLEQPDVGPRVNMDTVLLAGFARLRRDEAVCELGCAHGALSLIMAWRHESCRFTGLDLQEPLIELARRNATLNGLDERLRFLSGDLCNVSVLPLQSFDVVVANPPYEEAGQGMACRSETDRLARQGEGCSLAQVIQAASRLLRGRGRFYLVMRSRRLVDTLDLLRRHDLEACCVRFVHSKAERNASVFLLEARRLGGVSMKVLPPLVMYHHDGTYTPEFEAFYGRERPPWPSS